MAEAFIAAEDSDNKLIVAGRIAYVFQHNAGGSSENTHGNAASRLNLVYERYLDNQVTLIARWEEGLDPFFSTSKGDAHRNRYKFLGVSQPVYGTFTVGRQNALLYDFVDVFTDQPWYYADYAEVVQQGNDINGVLQRASDTLKYVNTLGKWTLGALYGWSRGGIQHNTHSFMDAASSSFIEYPQSYGMQRKSMFQLGGQYRPFRDLTLGAAYHHARVDAASVYGYDKPNANAWNLGANWTPGQWNLAVVGGKTRNAVGLNKAYRHYASFAGYTVPQALGEWGDVNLYYGYNRRKDEHSDDKLERHIVGVAAILLDKHLDVALDHMWFKDSDREGRRRANHHPATALYLRYNY